jgi:hypothetical protein
MAQRRGVTMGFDSKDIIELPQVKPPSFVILGALADWGIEGRLYSKFTCENPTVGGQRYSMTEIVLVSSLTSSLH